MPMGLFLGLLLTLFGVLLLLASLAGVALGLFVATRRGTRRQGLSFALWWMPAAAASVGVIMRDPVTLFVGVFCFAVGAVAISLERRARRAAPKTAYRSFEPSERTTQRRIRTRAAQQRRAS